MRAVIMDAPGKVHTGEWETPRPGHGEVLIAPRAVGVCAGDLYIYQGKNAYVTYPQIAGHEVAGVVEELGPGAIGLRVGDRVVVEPFLGCGKCYPSGSASPIAAPTCASSGSRSPAEWGSTWWRLPTTSTRFPSSCRSPTPPSWSPLRLEYRHAGAAQSREASMYWCSVAALSGWR